MSTTKRKKIIMPSFKEAKPLSFMYIESKIGQIQLMSLKNKLLNEIGKKKKKKIGSLKV